HKLWARLVARQARASGVERQGADTFGYQPPNGAAALRAELVAYLAVARGIHCSPGQVLVTNGFQGALSLIARAVLAPGDLVRVEDPGYSRGREALSLAGLKVVGTPVDADGLVVDY